MTMLILYLKIHRSFSTHTFNIIFVLLVLPFAYKSKIYLFFFRNSGKTTGVEVIRLLFGVGWDLCAAGCLNVSFTITVVISLRVKYSPSLVLVVNALLWLELQ